MSHTDIERAPGVLVESYLQLHNDDLACPGHQKDATGGTVSVIVFVFPILCEHAMMLQRIAKMHSINLTIARQVSTMPFVLT